MTQATLNGETIAALSLNSRAAQYGDGVFRTMLANQGKIWHEAAQIKVLQHDAAAIGLQVPTTETLQQALRAQAADMNSGVLKATVFAEDTPRGYARDSDRSQLLVQCSALAPEFANKLRRGANIVGLDFKLGANQNLAGIKHLNRLEQVLARRLQPSESDEALVMHPAGGWFSGIMSNVFWYNDGRWHTPDIQVCGIRGLMRQLILQHLEQQQIPCQLVTSASTEALNSADMMFICNSLMGAWPVASWRAHDSAEACQWSDHHITRFEPFSAIQQFISHPLLNDQ